VTLPHLLPHLDGDRKIAVLPNGVRIRRDSARRTARRRTDRDCHASWWYRDGNADRDRSPGTPTATPPPGPCMGDCDDNGTVAINELITMVNIALGSQPVANCLNGDPDDSGQIAINEIVQAVNSALNGC
jgi:hypothetical protein